MNYRNVYRVLATKKAIDVLIDICEGCKIEQYLSFTDLSCKYKMSKPSLRRLTNRLSRSGLIKPIKNKTSSDGRTRVYVVNDIDICEKIISLTTDIAN